MRFSMRVVFLIITMFAIFNCIRKEEPPSTIPQSAAREFISIISNEGRYQGFHQGEHVRLSVAGKTEAIFPFGLFVSEEKREETFALRRNLSSSFTSIEVQLNDSAYDCSLGNINYEIIDRNLAFSQKSPFIYLTFSNPICNPYIDANSIGMFIKADLIINNEYAGLEYYWVGIEEDKNGIWRVGNILYHKSPLEP